MQAKAEIRTSKGLQLYIFLNPPSHPAPLNTNSTHLKYTKIIFGNIPATDLKEILRGVATTVLYIYCVKF